MKRPLVERLQHTLTINVWRFTITLWFRDRARWFSYEIRPGYLSVGIAHPRQHAWWSTRLTVGYWG